MSKNNENSGADMTRSTVTERDGLFELEAGSDVLDSPRYDHDIAPTQVHERTWNKWHITALWVGMSICVPTYTLGGEIGRAHVCTPVTNADIVCTLLLEK